MIAQFESHNNGGGEVAGPKTKEVLSAKEFSGLVEAVCLSRFLVVGCTS
jgi:hypothetical protein